MHVRCRQDLPKTNRGDRNDRPEAVTRPEFSPPRLKPRRVDPTYEQLQTRNQQLLLKEDFLGQVMVELKEKLILQKDLLFPVVDVDFE